jgi:hypothetical protein
VMVDDLGPGAVKDVLQFFDWVLFNMGQCDFSETFSQLNISKKIF